jgi:hypothetical protein
VEVGVGTASGAGGTSCRSSMSSILSAKLAIELAC